MAVTFTPPRAPSVGLSEQMQPRVISVPFGDGYSQDSADGINTLLAKVSLSWNSLSKDDAATICDFFIARGGVERITYTLPDEATARLWKCTGWTKSRPRRERYTVSAQFQETPL